MTGEKALTAKATSSPPRKSKFRLFGLGLAVLAVFISLGGLVLGRLGYLWIAFDLFSQFTMQFVFLLVAGCMGLIVPCCRGVVATGLFITFLALYSLWPYYATSGTEQALRAHEKRLRVMQFNVYGKHLNLDQAAVTVKTLDPDIISLVEFDDSNKPLLISLKEQYPYQATCWEDRECETVILSKLPVTAIRSQSSWEGANYMIARLGPDYANLRVVSTHTTRFPHARAQLKQVNALARELQGPGPLIVMGDFNATPFSRITKTFASSLGLKLKTSLPSWPADTSTPQIAIDHIFSSPDIRALDHEVAGQHAASDHLPIALTLAVPVN